MKILSVFALIRDVAIIVVCVCILVSCVHIRSFNDFYFALPITSEHFHTTTDIDLESFNGEIFNPKAGRFGEDRKIPLDVRIVK